jgi:hypothetical protein
MRVWRPFSFPGLRSAQGVEGGGSINVHIRNIMNQRIKSLGLALLAAAAVGMSTQAQNISIRYVEDAGGVTLSYTGSVDLTGWTYDNDLGHFAAFGTGGRGSFINSITFSDSVSFDNYSIATDLLGNPVLNDLSQILSGFSGNPFEYKGNGSTAFLSVPHGYTSGTISGSMRFDGQTLASLGIPTGPSYSISLPGNTITVVPEPSEWAAMGAGLCGAVALVRRLRQRANA